MGKKEEIEQVLLETFAPERMQLVNESYMHSVPKGSESHWNLILVSPHFAGQSLLQRQRSVYAALGGIMQSIHALTMKTMTPEEWTAAGGEVTNPAPQCMGGSKHKKA